MAFQNYFTTFEQSVDWQTGDHILACPDQVYNNIQYYMVMDTTGSKNDAQKIDYIEKISINFIHFRRI